MKSINAKKRGLKMKKRNQNVMLIITFVLTIINIILTAFVGIALAFNLFGAMDIFNQFVSTFIIGGYDVSMYMTSYVINLILTMTANIYAGIFYFKGIKYRVNNKQYGRAIIFYAIMQLLFSAYIPAIFAFITAIIMINKKPVVLEEKVTQSFLSDYKLMAMSEAVTRLKELRASGAISEEEYYANLNKILEG